MQRFSNSIANKKIFNLIGSSKHVQEAIYDITLHLYSDDLQYKISKKNINGLTVRFSEKNYKELVEAYIRREKDNWNVLINNCNYISCQEIQDLNNYIQHLTNGKIETHNLFVYANKMMEIKDSCVHITCKCKNSGLFNMKEYYLSEKYDSSKQIVRSLLMNNNDKILILPQRKKLIELKPCDKVYFQPDI